MIYTSQIKLNVHDLNLINLTLATFLLWIAAVNYSTTQVTPAGTSYIEFY